MLKIEFLGGPQDRRKFLNHFDSENETWVVSDLKLKFEIQNHIFKEKEYYEDHSVLRISELWQSLLKRQNPEMQLCSAEWIQAWLKSRLSQEVDFDLGPNAYKTFFEAMNLFAPLYLGEPGTGRMKEWLRENPSSLARWGGWFLITEKYFEELVARKKVCQYWAVSLLQNQVQWAQVWKKKIIFDLGLQISHLEAEIIRSLSRDLDIVVLIPNPEIRKSYSYLFRPYETILSEAQSVFPSETPALTPSRSFQKIKAPGVLGEIKMAVETIRHWIETGTRAEGIALVAPDIETYWPILRPLLDKEGILYQKSQVIRWSALPIAYTWLARLKMSAGQVSYDQLEVATYSSLTEPPRFEEFYSLFYEILGTQDLARHPAIEQAFKAHFRASDRLSRDEFFGFATQSFSVCLQALRRQGFGREVDSAELSFSCIELVFKEIFSQTAAQEELLLSDWIFWLERILTKKEKTLEKGAENGIHLANISGADSLSIIRKYYLGLSENLLKKTQRRSLISGEEVQKLASETGYFFEDPDIVPAEFDLGWQELGGGVNVYSYPETGFNGAADAASAIWLSLQAEELKYQEPRLVWDYETQIFQSQLAGENAEESLFPQLVSNESKGLSLSVSQIETYLKCPYILLAQKFFRQEDRPLSDMEVDRRTSGSLIHAILEYILKNPDFPRVTEKQIGDQLDVIQKESELKFLDASIWKALKKKYAKVSLQFIEAEKDYRAQFPGFKSSYLEQDFSLRWDQARKSFLDASKTTSGVLLRGRMDRIDEDQSGNLVLYDYKSSKGSYKNWGSWLKDHRLQLLIYILAIDDQGIPALQGKKAIGAFYYILKDMSRSLGLKLKISEQGLYNIENKKNEIDESSFEALKSETRELLFQTIQAILDGKFPAQPQDPSDCPKCRWRTQCRAPHLI